MMTCRSTSSRSRRRRSGLFDLQGTGRPRRLYRARSLDRAMRCTTRRDSSDRVRSRSSRTICAGTRWARNLKSAGVVASGTRCLARRSSSVWLPKTSRSRSAALMRARGSVSWVKPRTTSSSRNRLRIWMCDRSFEPFTVSLFRSRSKGSAIRTARSGLPARWNSRATLAATSGDGSPELDVSRLTSLPRHSATVAGTVPG